MSEVKRYHLTEAGLVEGVALGRLNVVLAADYEVARVREHELQQRLTAADERVDVLEAENRRLREDDLFYDAACEAMEGHQKERAKLGKEIGCQGSLIDGIAWIYHRLAELESAEGGGEVNPSNCTAGHPGSNCNCELCRG